MDFDSAIDVHSKWKVRLRAVIAGNDKLDPARISTDDSCDLGCWIHGEGKKFANSPLYTVLRAEHARFHQCAAKVVSESNSGNRAAAEALMAAGGEFARASQATVSAIRKMKSEFPTG